jgi:hypothetical protein
MDRILLASTQEGHMRHTCSSAWTLLVMTASITSTAAQAGAPKSPQATPDVGRTVTLQGCLKSWDGSPTGIGRETAGQPPMFVLTDVEEAPVAAPPKTATGTSGSSAPAAKAGLAHDTFVLEPVDRAMQLRSHVDQRVEVIGSLELIPPHDATAGGITSALPAPAGGGTAAGGAEPSLPTARTETPVPARRPMERVKVTAVKTLDARCR